MRRPVKDAKDARREMCLGVVVIAKSESAGWWKKQKGIWFPLM
jgi:hypothetical protein